MKKFIVIFCVILVIILLFFLIFKFITPNIKKLNIDGQNGNNSIQEDDNSNKNQNLGNQNVDNTKINTTEKVVANNLSVSYNGWLNVDGNKLKNEKNEIVQLKGISSHGIEWFSNLITFDNLKTLKEDWKINVFRIAMYTDANGQGYVFSPDTNIESVTKVVDIAVDLDMYVVVDWHILNDNNPLIHKQEAKEFFDLISKKYSNTPNVIYEICNEPNGDTVTWEKDVKPYAEEIIPIIRKNSEKSLIIVGTPDWCKDLESPANNPLNYDNVAYSLHFYSGSHGDSLKYKVDYCLEKNLLVFVSECGMTDASGNGNLYFNEFKNWINYLNSKNISWIYWSLSNKAESSALLLPSYSTESSAFNDYLTESGKLIKTLF